MMVCMALVVTTNDSCCSIRPAVHKSDRHGCRGTARTLPVPPANYPRRSSPLASGYPPTGTHLRPYDTIGVSLQPDAQRDQLIRLHLEPASGPAVVSVSNDGRLHTSGWALSNASGVLLSQFPMLRAVLNIGSHAIDSSQGFFMPRFSQGTGQTSAVPPINPATPAASTDISRTPPHPPDRGGRQPPGTSAKWQLAENSGWEILLNAARDTMYTISTAVDRFPVGFIESSFRAWQLTQEDLVFRGNFCNREPSRSKSRSTIPAPMPPIFQLLIQCSRHYDFTRSGTTPAL